jgi:hypothetical protein
MILLRRMLIIMILLAECLVGPLSHAESPAEEIKTEAPPLRTFSKKSQGKIQEVNFEEMGLKGTLRNPEGSYLVQKRGLKFMPLIEVQKNFDGKIRETSDYVKGSL